MKTKEYLDQVAYKKEVKGEGGFPDSVNYLSKFDDSYITMEGMEDNVSFLAEREITEQLTHGVGFSPKDNKWYGWSHRAIYGFAVGSECKKGQCHYHGSTLEEQEEDAIAFWSGEHRINVRCEGVIGKGEDRYFDIKWDYTEGVPNKKRRGTTSGSMHHIKPLGRGEWIAKTMEDAKQMAVDFNKGVS